MTNGKGTFTNEIDFSDYDKQKDLTVMENRYDRYKDSGIAWIGVIPEHWEVKFIKSIFVENKEICNDKRLTLLSLSQYTGIKPKSETDIATSHIAESYEGYKLVKKGQFVMNIMLAWNGSYAVSNYEGMISPAYCVFDFRGKSIKQYYHYLLRLSGYSEAFKTRSKGIIDSRLRLYPESFYKFSTIIPPLAEQQAIADYLDRRCSEIDDLIALQEEMITKLQSYKQSVITEAVTRGLDKNVPLKDSGIDWIGKIPEHWNCTAFKRLLLEPMQYGANEPAEECDYNNPRYIRITDIKEDRTLRDDTFKSLPLEKAKDYILSKGDLLFARSGATVGKTFLYNEDNAACFAGYLIKAKCNKKKLVPNFVFYYTLSNIYQNWKNSIFIQSTIQNIGADKYSSMPIIVPPLAEQQAIADYLDQRCSEIDELIALKQQKIEKLKEYKKSLIFECVTGKRKVS